MQAVETELKVEMPIINPDTGGESRTFVYAGRIDRLESRKVIDYKTTQDVHKFLTEKRVGYQCELYALAMAHAGHPIDEIEFRLVTVPTIKFCRTDGGNWDAYETRCVDWLSDSEYPDRVFTHTIPISASRLDQARAFLWNASKRILENRRTGRWLMNEHGCYRWWKPCEYLPICEKMADGVDYEWVIGQGYKTWADPDHAVKLNGNRDKLHYSSISCFCLCDMKYFWNYERGIRPNYQDDEPLAIGGAAHVGLDALHKSGSMDAALIAIRTWMEAIPVIGPDVDKLEQRVRRANAIVRAAARRWP